MSQLVLELRMNAPRSGCPINLTLEALGMAGAWSSSATWRSATAVTSASCWPGRRSG